MRRRAVDWRVASLAGSARLTVTLCVGEPALVWIPLTSSPGRSLCRSELRPGSSELRPGSSELRPGSSELRPGSSGLRPGSSGLRPGSSELRPGSSELRLCRSELRRCRSELIPGSSGVRDAEPLPTVIGTTDRQAGRQTDIWTDRNTGGQANRNATGRDGTGRDEAGLKTTDGRTDGRTGRQTDRQSVPQTAVVTLRRRHCHGSTHTDTQTNTMRRAADRHRHGLTNTVTNRRTDILYY